RISCSRHSISFRSFFFQSSGDFRDLHSFPTRRSSDLWGAGMRDLLEFQCPTTPPAPSRGKLRTAIECIHGPFAYATISRRIVLEHNITQCGKSPPHAWATIAPV